MEADLTTVFRDYISSDYVRETDFQILRIIYTAKAIVSHQKIDSQDKLFLRDFSFSRKGDAVLFAAIDVYKLVEHMPFTVADSKAFRMLASNKFDDFRGVITFLESIYHWCGSDIMSTAINEIYCRYCVNMHNAGLNNHLSISEFGRLIAATSTYRYENTLSNYTVSKFSEHDNEPIVQMIDLLNISGIDRLRFCVDCYMDTPIEDLINDHIEGKFTQCSADEVSRTLASIKRDILQITPLRCAQLLSIAKATSYYKTSQETGKITKIRTTDTVRKSVFSIEKHFVNRFLFITSKE